MFLFILLGFVSRVMFTFLGFGLFRRRWLCFMLSGARLFDPLLSSAWLNCSRLLDTRLTGPRLTGSRLLDSRLSGAWLTCARLSDALLSGPRLSGAWLFDALLSSARLN